MLVVRRALDGISEVEEIKSSAAEDVMWLELSLTDDVGFRQQRPTPCRLEFWEGREAGWAASCLVAPEVSAAGAETSLHRLSARCFTPLVSDDASVRFLCCNRLHLR